MPNFFDGIRNALKSGKEATFSYNYDTKDIGIQDTDCQAMDFDCGRPSTVTRRSSGGQGARALLPHQEAVLAEYEEAVPAEYEEAVPAESQEVVPAESQEAVPAESQEAVPAGYQEQAPSIEQYQQHEYPRLSQGHGNFVVDGLMPPFIRGYSDSRAKEMDKRITHDNRIFVDRHKSEVAVADVLEELDLNAELNDMRRCMSYTKITPLPKELAVRAERKPFDNLPTSMQGIASNIGAYLDVDPEAVSLALLGVIFVSCRGNFIIEVKKGYWEALTEYLLVVMPSGSRKSAIIDFFRHFIDEAEKELQEAYKENASKRANRLEMLKGFKAQKKAEALKEFRKSGLDSIDDCVERFTMQVKPIDKEIQSIAACPKFCVDTPTPKALAMAAQQQGEAIGIYEAEGGVFKHRLKVSNDNIFLKAYTMESFGDETSNGNSVFMRKPCIAICSFVQSSVAEKIYLNETLKDDGFVPRILPAFLPRWKRYCVRTESVATLEEVIESCSKKIKSLLMLERPEGKIDERTYYTIRMSPEAQRMRSEYAERNREKVVLGHCDGIEAFVEKLAGHAIRLAGAIHVWEHDIPQDHEINGESMQGGIDLAEYFLEHVSVAYDENRVKALAFAKKILRWMNAHRKPRFTEREAQRGVGRCKIVEIRAGLEMLERHNYIRRKVDVKAAHCVVHPHYSFKEKA